MSPRPSKRASRGRSHLAGELGVSPRPSKRASRGRSLLAGAWGCPPVLLSTPPPTPPLRAQRSNPGRRGSGRPEGAAIWRGNWGCPPDLLSGRPEGAAFWQGPGGVPQYFFLLPLLPRHCERSEAIRGGGEAGVQRAQPSGGGTGGVPQTLFLLPPSFQEWGQGDGPSHS